MTFLWPLSLLFGLTALVPLALHLYQQQQRRVMEFSTHRFFTASVIRAQRRLRLRQWILLLLRMAACLLIALAAAQPISSWLSSTGSSAGRRDLVILLDDSLSMSAKSDADQPTHFELARQLARSVLDQLSPGDHAAIIRLSHLSEPTPKLDAAITPWKTFLDSSSVSHQAADIATGLKKAAQLLTNSDSVEGRQPIVLLLTDAQRSGFPHAVRLTAREPIPLLIQTVGQPTRRNTAITGVNLTPAQPLMGQWAQCSLRLVNHQSQPIQGHWVLLQDGREIRRQSVTLPPQGQLTEYAPLLFDQPGRHELKAMLDIPDDLARDNQRQKVIHVAASMPILLVDAAAQYGRPGRQSPAFFMDAALTCATDQPTNPLGLKPQVISPIELDRASLETYRTILLANWASLSQSQLERLKHYVEQGGGLAIFLGEVSQPDVLRPLLDSLFSLSLTPPQLQGETAPSAENPLEVHQAIMTSPLLRGIDESAITGWQVNRRWLMQDAQSSCLIRLCDQSPWLLEKRIGQGRLLVFSTPMLPGWTNLPLRKSFVPLMQNLVRHMAKNNPPPPADDPSDQTPDDPPASESSVATVDFDRENPLAKAWRIQTLSLTDQDPTAAAIHLQKAMERIPSQGRLWDLLLAILLAVLLIEPLLANLRRLWPNRVKQEARP